MQCREVCETRKICAEYIALRGCACGCARVRVRERWRAAGGKRGGKYENRTKMRKMSRRFKCKNHKNMLQ